MQPRSLRFVVVLALGAAAPACNRAASQTPRERPPASGGPSCMCEPPNAQYQGRHACAPAALDAGCTTIMTPGGPLPPPELRA